MAKMIKVHELVATGGLDFSRFLKNSIWSNRDCNDALHEVYSDNLVEYLWTFFNKTGIAKKAPYVLLFVDKYAKVKPSSLPTLDRIEYHSYGAHFYQEEANESSICASFEVNPDKTFNVVLYSKDGSVSGTLPREENFQEVIKFLDMES